MDKPFALFGHSMGALIAFELARYLRKEYSAQPLHLFVSGRPSPQTISESYELDQLDAALPEMLPGNPELMELVLPLLRADLAVCKSYVYTPQPPFSFPITAFGGLEDDGVPRHCLEGWREHTTGSFRLRFFPGDHFFLETCRLPLLEAISKELEQDVSRNVM